MVGSEFLILISILVTDLLARIAFLAQCYFPLNNDLRRELQGPVLRCKHLYRGREWKRANLSFFP